VSILNTIGSISSEKSINTVMKKSDKGNIMEVKDSLEAGSKSEVQDFDSLKKMASSTPRVTELVKPELKPAINELITKFDKILQAGQGELPLTDILKLFPGIPDDIVGKLKERGNIKFKSLKPSEMTFENTGKKLDFDITAQGSEYTVKIPNTIKGTVSSNGDGFGMNFDKKNTISAGKYFIYLGLEKINIDKEKVFIDFEKDMADILIKFV
jgi:hypothetical protein